jgi:hypothetical protein
MVRSTTRRWGLVPAPRQKVENKGEKVEKFHLRPQFFLSLTGARYKIPIVLSSGGKK